MMRDDFEDRLRTAMRRESKRLSFAVTTADVERRLAAPSRRFPRWLALGAVPLATAAVIGILLGSGPRTPADISTAPADCQLVSSPAPAGTVDETASYAAWLQVSPSQLPADPGSAPLTARVYPETDISRLFIRGWMVRSDDPRVGGATTHANLGRLEQGIDQKQPLPGTDFAGSIRLPGRGCWQIEAFLDDIKIGSAVVFVGGNGVTTTTTGSARCPVTRRPDPPFIPPARFPTTPPGRGAFWYGSDELWTAVNDDGLWGGVPDASGGYGNKSFWWSAAYKVDEEPQPALLVLARRLDGPETAQSGEATNAAASDIGSAMLTGLTVPTSGCWELTGSYRGHELSYVVWIPGPDD
jgi:hypothetical protein